jgi:hypothetical protein
MSASVSVTGTGLTIGITACTKRTKHMAKKILILSASPRKGWNSDLLCDQFMRGAAEAGHEVEKIFLNDVFARFWRRRRKQGEHKVRPYGISAHEPICLVVRGANRKLPEKRVLPGR